LRFIVLGLIIDWRSDLSKKTGLESPVFHLPANLRVRERTLSGVAGSQRG
jgi:hypothetical protein